MPRKAGTTTASRPRRSPAQEIQSDLAALQSAIHEIKAQYEEHMTSVREAHQAAILQIQREGADDAAIAAGTLELDQEMAMMEIKMEFLNTQAWGLESSLQSYSKRMEEGML